MVKKTSKYCDAQSQCVVMKEESWSAPAKYLQHFSYSIFCCYNPILKWIELNLPPLKILHTTCCTAER